jgi:hypothetical protein
VVGFSVVGVALIALMAVAAVVRRAAMIRTEFLYLLSFGLVWFGTGGLDGCEEGLMM